MSTRIRSRLATPWVWLLLAAVVAWAAAVFWGSVIMRPATVPGPVDGVLGMVGPLGAHFAMYMVLSGLLLALFSGLGWFPQSKAAPLLVAVVLAAAYGGLMEVLQGMVPERHMSLLDAVVNTAGALVGAAGGAVVVLWFLSYRRRARAAELDQRDARM